METAFSIGEWVRVDENATLEGITKGVIRQMFGNLIAVARDEESACNHLVNVKYIHKLEE